MKNDSCPCETTPCIHTYPGLLEHERQRSASLYAALYALTAAVNKLNTISIVQNAKAISDLVKVLPNVEKVLHVPLGNQPGSIVDFEELQRNQKFGEMRQLIIDMVTAFDGLRSMPLVWNNVLAAQQRKAVEFLEETK